ncbi:MAG: WD40 repeat domain-containing protein [Cytophagales bacterium]|nr:WD40 repeat domain-containing protein [Cytophagales bacterium]
MTPNIQKICTFSGHRDGIFSIAASGNADIFYAASGDGMVVKWNIQNPDNGILIATVSHSVYAIHALFDSNILVVGENFEGIHLINTDEHNEIGSFRISSGYIFDIVSYGKLLFVACANGTVYIIDANTLSIIKKLEYSTQSARCIAINPLYGHIAVGYSDYKIRIFSLSDYSLIYEYTAHNNSVFALYYTHDGSCLLSGSRDAHLKFWDCNSNYMLDEQIVAHMFAINNIHFHHMGNFFATASMDKTIKIWDYTKRKLLKVIDKSRHGGHTTSVNKVLWMQDKYQLLSCSDDKLIHMWEVNI